MNTNRNAWITYAAALLFCALWTSDAQVQIPAAINYQGKLTDDQGDPLTNGYYVVEFRIWKDPTLSSVAELAWGRSFPIHVVENGLFNVLLSNDGAVLSDGGTGSLLSAFDGPDRYLGLTLVQTPSGTVANPAEIKPRQRLVSAPYTIQAQSANLVAPDGVSTASLANGSVTTAKIAAGNVTQASLAADAVTTAKVADATVTTAKIADAAVTTAKIADSSVTTAKLNVNADVRLNGHALLVEGPSDTTSAVRYNSSGFHGFTNAGPIVVGEEGGALGTANHLAMTWSDAGVGLWGQHITSTWPGNGSTRSIQANTDGLIFVYTGDRIWFQVRRGGPSGSTVFPTTDDSPPNNAAGLLFTGTAGEAITYPVRAGDVAIVLKEAAHSDGANSVFRFIPLGISTEASANEF